MSVNYVGTGIDYTKWNRINNTNNTNYSNNTTTNIYSENDKFVSSNGETCTDGNDDGKIGFFSKVGNVAKGILKQAGNMVKGAIQHPFKTALLLGACFIPMVGPVITAGLCAYGVYSGGKQIINGIKQANAATNDADAKNAWQNIGGGGLTLGLSVTGLKGSIKAFKTQVGLGKMGMDGACQTFKAIKNNAKAGEVLKTAATETVENAANAAKAAGRKIQEKGNKLNEISDSLKENGFKETAKDLYYKSKTYQRISDYVPSKETIKNTIENARLDGAEIEFYDSAKTMPKKITYSDGTVMEYSRIGRPTKTITVDGAKTITTNDNTYTTEINQNNKMYRETFNEKTGVTETKSLSTNEAGTTKGTWSKSNSNTGSGYKTVLKKYNNGQVLKDTNYTFNDKQYSASDLNVLQKGYIKIDTGNVGTSIYKANPNTRYVAPIINAEEN